MTSKSKGLEMKSIALYQKDGIPRNWFITGALQAGIFHMCRILIYFVCSMFSYLGLCHAFVTGNTLQHTLLF